MLMSVARIAGENSTAGHVLYAMQQCDWMAVALSHNQWSHPFIYHKFEISRGLCPRRGAESAGECWIFLGPIFKMTRIKTRDIC
ncbi:hypothetical protein [Ancylobacter sp. G4_0304]|uniref:hypothetical protein n=1 Tax=Ancylobacter sp. G4_0304 TaxID=3114289 RepID=UPI0039C75C17